MTDQTITDDNGEMLRLIGRMKTAEHNNDSSKPINTDSTTVEVIVSDGRTLSQGSQWGHVALEIDGIVYGMSHNGYDKRKKDIYLQDNRSFRDSIGVVLRVSPDEKRQMKEEFERRGAIGGAYNIIGNSCSTNVADVLEGIGILAHDPRFFFSPSSNSGVTPKELLTVVLRSKRVMKTLEYRKN